MPVRLLVRSLFLPRLRNAVVIRFVSISILVRFPPAAQLQLLHEHWMIINWSQNRSDERV